MKKNKLFLAVLPLFILVSCEDKTTSSFISNSVSEPTSDSTAEKSSIASSDPISSTSSAREGSSVEDGKEKKVDVTKFKNQFNTSIDQMEQQDRFGIKTTASSLGIKGDIQQNKTYLDANGQVDATKDAKTNNYDFDLLINNLNVDYNVAKTTTDEEEKIDASLVVGGTTSLTYNSTLEGEKTNKTFTPVNFALNTYYTDSYYYLDLSNAGLGTLGSNLLSLVPENYQLMLSYFSLPSKYLKFNLGDDGLPSSNPLPTIKSAVNSILDNYSSISMLTTNIIDFTMDANYTYLSINLTTNLLKSVPLIYSTYALSQLDTQAEDYTEQLEEITNRSTKIADVINKIKINNAQLKLAFDDQGFKYFDTNIDIELNDYVAQSKIDEEIDEETDEESDEETEENTLSYKEDITIKKLQVSLNSKIEFTYGQSVVVATPNSETTYVDVSEMLSAILPFLKGMLIPND